jgi:hypothetical protein
MVKWVAKTSDGIQFNGSTHDGSWLSLKTAIGPSRRVTSVRLENDFGVARIDDYRDGYVVSNKVLASLQGGQQIELVGIGYWSSVEDVARIKWYLAKTMELQYSEARPTDSIDYFLIRNP